MTLIGGQPPETGLEPRGRSVRPSRKWPTLMAYWLFKSEPECFSFADLEAAPDRTTGWDGVRNYQARNFLRDQVRRGDGVLFYHSSAEPPAIAGVAEVVVEAHPDPTAFDPAADHHDPKSDPTNPTWFQVAIRAVRPVDPPIPLAQLRALPELAGMELLRKGSRLSIQPVKPEEWQAIMRLAGLESVPSRSRARSASPAKAPKAPRPLAAGARAKTPKSKSNSK